MHKKIIGICLLLSMPLFAKKQVLYLDDDKVLKAAVSKEGMTRLSLEGDRIKDIMGLDESISTEKDDQNGVLFLKSVSSSQTITIITENGDVQEMELTPSKEKSHQIVLKQKNKESNTNDFFNEGRGGVTPFQTPSPLMSFQGTGYGVQKTFPQRIIDVMRFLYRATENNTNDDPISFKKIKDLKVDSMINIKENGLLGHTYMLKNTSKQLKTLKEKDFKEKGVLAVAFEREHLTPNQTTRLFVIRQG